MGLLNQDEYKKIEKLKDKKCPICDGIIEILESDYRPRRESFDYKCIICSPKGVIISIAMRAVGSSNFDKIEIKFFLKRKIDNCTDNEVYINTHDLKIKDSRCLS